MISSCNQPELEEEYTVKPDAAELLNDLGMTGLVVAFKNQNNILEVVDSAGDKFAVKSFRNDIETLEMKPITNDDMIEGVVIMGSNLDCNSTNSTANVWYIPIVEGECTIEVGKDEFQFTPDELLNFFKRGVTKSMGQND